MFVLYGRRPDLDFCRQERRSNVEFVWVFVWCRLFLRRSVVAVDTDVDLTLMFAGRRSGVGFI